MSDSSGQQQSSGSQGSTQQANSFVIDDAGAMPQIQETGAYDQLHLRSKTGGQTISFTSKNKDALSVIEQLAAGNTDWEVQTGSTQSQMTGGQASDAQQSSQR